MVVRPSSRLACHARKIGSIFGIIVGTRFEIARKTIAYFGIKAVRAMTGIEMIPEVTIAIRKA